MNPGSKPCALFHGNGMCRGPAAGAAACVPGAGNHRTAGAGGRGDLRLEDGGSWPQGRVSDCNQGVTTCC